MVLAGDREEGGPCTKLFHGLRSLLNIPGAVPGRQVQHFKEIVPVHCTSDKVFTVSGTLQ